MLGTNQASFTENITEVMNAISHQEIKNCLQHGVNNLLEAA
jgi:hypothetical protein